MGTPIITSAQLRLLQEQGWTIQHTVRCSDPNNSKGCYTQITLEMPASTLENIARSVGYIVALPFVAIGAMALGSIKSMAQSCRECTEDDNEENFYRTCNAVYIKDRAVDALALQPTARACSMLSNKCAPFQQVTYQAIYRLEKNDKV